MADSMSNLIELINIVGSMMEQIEIFMVLFQDNIWYISLITIFFVIAIISYFLHMLIKSGKLLSVATGGK